MIAGVDEAGRGPLAGPVVASAVILDPDNIPDGLRDSKKLSEKKRTKMARLIWENALAVGVGIVHEQDIDRTNILKATFEAMRRAVSMLSLKPDEVQVDGKFTIPDLMITQKALVGGDDLVQEISAASIIAKTTRDAMMRSYHVLFPEYGFKSHKGYGSASHMAALREYGRTPVHRRSFRPVDNTPNQRYGYHDNPGNHGKMGEILAGMFLIRQGYQLLAHSYHAGNRGEIDLIAAKADQHIFIEVKSYCSDEDDQTALERVTPEKQKQIAKTAAHYLESAELLNADSRFDIITVNFHTPKPDINHYPDAYLPF